jgi:hypothetical protein
MREPCLVRGVAEVGPHWSVDGLQPLVVGVLSLGIQDIGDAVSVQLG